ncbi:hypothetical protein K1718_15695 [Roseibium porphyridii]|uniref:CENP-V/GFA domain-containing protein n=1 Tax=Roseibium porphyridii TaxID=2866279 RepID=A0ABY8EX60_9HYPH|nr:hypothetical protein [Roseibium sp. KMA01]WFE87607.1 hypothetical protein K1718_15695 [Roseibium sp. KMA01]
MADLLQYRWGTRTAVDYFCPICGVLPFRRPSQLTLEERTAGLDPFDGWSINLRCIDEIDLDALPKRRIFGSRLQI